MNQGIECEASESTKRRECYGLQASWNYETQLQMIEARSRHEQLELIEFLLAVRTPR